MNEFWNRIIFGPQAICSIVDDAATDAGPSTDIDAANDMGSFDDDPIGSLNRVAEEEENAGGEGDGSGAPKGDEAIPPHIQARIEKAEDRAIAAEQTNKFWQGKLSALEQQLNNQNGRQAEAPVKEEKQPLFKLPTREEIQKKLENSDTAADTILQMFGNLATNIETKFNEVTENNQNQFTQRDAHQRMQTAFQNDVRKVISEFTEEIARDPDFTEEADKLVEEMAAARGMKSALPGDLYNAAYRVYHKWEKEGKLARFNKNGSEQNTNGRPKLREVVRQINGNSERMNGAGSNGRKSGAPKSFADLGFSPQEERVARLAAKRLGVGEAEFVKNYSLASQEDDSFGK